VNSYSDVCSRCAHGDYDREGFFCELWGYYIFSPEAVWCEYFYPKKVEMVRERYER
jgi:hypothetical protein